MMQIAHLVQKFLSPRLLSRCHLVSPRVLCTNMASESQEKNESNDNRKDRIVWVDLETSGLDIDTEHILEMACLVTDADLNVIAQYDDLVINQPDSVLDNMNDWCKEHHGKSGLTEAVRNSKISLTDAENRMLKFVQQHTIKGKSPLAGNSIHADRVFLSKYMPQFTDHLHYRIIDVSTIKELTRRWYPKVYQSGPHKKESHRALDDIKESIEELQYYRNSVFKDSMINNDKNE